MGNVFKSNNRRRPWRWRDGDDRRRIRVAFACMSDDEGDCWGNGSLLERLGALRLSSDDGGIANGNICPGVERTEERCCPVGAFSFAARRCDVDAFAFLAASFHGYAPDAGKRMLLASVDAIVAVVPSRACEDSLLQYNDNLHIMVEWMIKDFDGRSLPPLLVLGVTSTRSRFVIDSGKDIAMPDLTSILGLDPPELFLKRRARWKNSSQRRAIWHDNKSVSGDDGARSSRSHSCCYDGDSSLNPWHAVEEADVWRGLSWIEGKVLGAEDK